MMNNNRLDEIAERNSRSRVADIAFAAMIALLMVLCLASLRSAGASPLRAHQNLSSGDNVAHVIADHACFVELDC